jgi:hypothetical protein
MGLALALVAAGCGDDDDVPAQSGDVEAGEEAGEASASFTAPTTGDTVAQRFTVAMEATGVEIEPAGEVRDGAGHFHVMVDTGCLDPGETIPSDDQHVHFGKGQLEGQLFLEPGEHELCLQVGDGAHTALPISDELSVTVDGDEPYVTLGVPEGDTLTSPVAITMEAHGVEIEPAGEVRDGAGHFHVIVDGDCVQPGETIPNDETHLHFGDGRTSSEVALDPGEHTICLQVGDGAHTALPITHRLAVVVE